MSSCNLTGQHEYAKVTTRQLLCTHGNSSCHQDIADGSGDALVAGSRRHIARVRVVQALDVLSYKPTLSVCEPADLVQHVHLFSCQAKSSQCWLCLSAERRTIGPLLIPSRSNLK